MATANKLISVDYEVFGKVQGVFFRKYTNQEARKLSLVGTVENTPKGTVLGVIQGQRDKVATMKKWLQKTGSPKSRIERCVFKNEREIDKADFTEFKIIGKD